MKKIIIHQFLRTGKLTAIIAILSSALWSCRKDSKVTPDNATEITDPLSASKKSFYLLNEGNMDMNKASLDFFDHQTGIYKHNIFEEINPDVTRGLGDVGNDMQVYGAKLYIVVNNSNKIEVLNVHTGKRIAKIDLTNGRYITFYKGKAYVSSYQSRVGDSNSANGYVARIDTATLEIEQTVMVGRQPEEMAIVGEKLYVANSGGYDPQQYENTVSVVDLNTFREIKKIEVAINLDRVKADQYGDIYVTSRGDSYTISSNLFVIDSSTDEVRKKFDLGASNLCIDGDRAYVVSVEYSYTSLKNVVSYALIDVKNETVINRSFITDGTDKEISRPYGIAVDPVTKDIYVTDAKDYVTPGVLYCFDSSGRKKWSVTTGDIPAHFAFIN